MKFGVWHHLSYEFVTPVGGGPERVHFSAEECRRYSDTVELDDVSLFNFEYRISCAQLTIPLVH